MGSGKDSGTAIIIIERGTKNKEKFYIPKSH